MGQEISTTRFRHHDFARFERLIDQELETLREWFRGRRFSRRRSIAGLELETWIVSDSGEPLPANTALLAMANSSDVVPELSRFNIEFNVTPQPLAGPGIAALERDLGETWRRCDRLAGQLGASLVSIGTLPTLEASHLSMANMSEMRRYKALNEQVLRLRAGRPIRLDIEGHERLQVEHDNALLEAATTSFQMHLQVAAGEGARFFNASLLLAAPLVAVGANSPLLFGRILWNETRIPLFEQAVDVGGGKQHARVTFGSGYARESLEEVFVENREQYPVIFPLAMDEASERLEHLRLHNGTIWRWVRPLIGFDDDGTPHLRIEQRVLPAGPTTVDMAANMAFHYGLAEALATDETPPESRLPFATARDNFYRAARFGFDAQITWLDDRQMTVRELILWELLPLARTGLSRLQVDGQDTFRLLEIIEQRVTSGQNGAAWQRRYLEQHGRDMAALTLAYRERQRAGTPVHEWGV